MYSSLARPQFSTIRRAISISPVFSGPLRARRLLAALAAAALLVCAGAHKAAAQTTFTGGGSISASGPNANASSILSVSGASGTVATISITMNGVTSSGISPNISVWESSFVLESPGGQKLVLLGGTGDSIDGDDAGDSGSGLSNVTITVQDGASAAPGSAGNPWQHTGSKTVKPSSYWNNPFGPGYLPTDINGDSLPQTDGSATLDGTFGSATANGTWTLFILTDDMQNGANDPITVTSWSLTMTFNGAADNTSTSVSSNTSNPASTTGSITYTATVSDTDHTGTTVSNGTVAFTANGTTISGCAAQPISGGTATCSTTFAQGLYGIVAAYTPVTGFSSSTSSSIEQLVENPTTNSTDTWCNTGSVSIPLGGTGLAYPSAIKVSGYSAGTTVSNVEVELEGVTGIVYAQHLLVAPDGTHNLDFFDSDFNLNSVSSPGVNLDFLDAAGQYPNSNEAPASGSYEAADEGPAGETFPSSSAPTYDSSIPQVPGTVIYAYDNIAPATHGPITETFESNFAGISPNGTWALYPYETVNGVETIGSGWCLALTLNSSSSAPTTTTVTSSKPDQTTGSSVTLTATVTETSGGSPVTSGFVTFLENGVAPPGITSPNNVVTVNSSGQAPLTTSSFPQGDNTIVAEYSGVTNDFDASQGSFTQRMDDATTITQNSNVYTYCNTGAITGAQGNHGPLSPNPSNISVTNLPGTPSAVTLTLQNFSAGTGTVPFLESMVAGPSGATNLDFFSNVGTGSGGGSGESAVSAGNFTFSDSGSANLSEATGSISAGTYLPTSYVNQDSNYTEPANPYTASASNLFTLPSAIDFAATRGSGTFAGAFAGNSRIGVWSLYFNELVAAEAVSDANGWCLNFSENPVAVTADENHSGAGTGGDFIQGETGAQITAAVTNNGPGSTGDPVGTNPLTVVDTLNSAFTYASSSGTGWSCSAAGQTVTCTNDSAVASGSSYPTLTLNVNVSASASSPIDNSLSVSGAGVTATNSSTDHITVDSSQIAPAITSGSSTTFTVGTTSSFTVAATGSPAPTFTETGSLPTGVTLATNGTLSGTPAAGTGGSYSITITASNGVSPNATQNFTLTVDQAPAITSAAATTFAVGTAGSFTATATGYPAPTFSETGSLPTGVTLATNGTLSGTPAAGTGGVYTITITAGNGSGTNATQNFTLTVNQAPAITSGAAITFAAGAAGSFTVTASGNPAPTFSETGALPSGVTLATNGTLSGTPAAGTGGTYPITITASNGIGTNATQNFTLTVNQAPAITSAAATTFTVGTAGSFSATASGNPAPTFSETGTLPSGVSLASNGTLSGTPAAGTGGTYPITITAGNGTGTNATQNFTLTVDQAPAITSAAATTFAAGAAGSFTVTASGNPAPTFSETGTLPSGVSLATNGTLSGTPGAGTGGSYPITITASNGIGTNATQNFTLTVNQAPAITSAAATTFAVGTAGLFTVTASGNPAPTFSETGTLPSGVTFVSNGTLSGTPAAGTGGVYTITITAGNGSGTNATQNFTLTVDQAPAITSASAARFTVGVPGTFAITTTAFPAAALSLSGTLPSGITFIDNGNGTGTLQGTAAAGTPGSYPVTITAMNRVGVNGQQSFTLTIDLPPGFVVTNTDDAGSGSLRAALANAATAGSGNITFDPSAFASAQTITLTSGTLTIPSNTTIQGLTSGSGTTLINLVTMSCNDVCTVFTANSGVTGASIANMILTGSQVAIDNAGSLTVTNSTFSNNFVNLIAGGGGAINNTGSLTVSDSTFSNNSSAGAGIAGFGGAIYNVSGTLTVIDSTFSNNSAPSGDGGAIYNGGSLTVTNSTFSGNTAGSGGGISNNGSLTVTNSVFTQDSSGECVGSGCPTNGTNGNIVDPAGALVNLAPLGNYGGPTQTIIPLPGSAAICAGSASSAATAGITADQRGVAMSLSTSNASTYTGVGGYCAAGSLDAGAVETNYSMSFTAPVSNVAPNSAMSPAPAVTLDESGAPFTVASVTIPLTLASNPSGATLSGGSATTNAGVATYPALEVNLPGTGDQLTATLALNTSPAVSISAQSGTFNVSKITPTLSFVPNPASQTYGTAIVSGSLDATATYNSGNVAGTFAYTTTVNSNPVTLVAGTTVLPAGSYTITATFTPSDPTVYTTASATASYTVNAAALTITASSATMTYGGTVPTITPSYAGFVNGDSATSLTTQPTCSTTATSHSAVGSYPSTCSGAVDVNYTISYTPGSVTVGQVALTITASSATMTYGGTVPTITPSYSGFVNGDSATSLTAQPSCSTTATSHSAAGGYPSSCTGAVDANYTIGYTAGSVTVGQVALTITASSATMTYGGTVPTITPSYAGFVNGDSATSLTTQPTCSTTATSHSAAGGYPSSCTGAVDANYTIGYTAGSVTVGQAALNITASNATKTYGTANPVFTGTVTGQQNGDTFVETFSTSATVPSPVGAYQIVPSVTGAHLSDYSQTIVDGTLTVTQAASITTVGLSSPSITPGQSETITATVASSTTGTPTGSVNIYDGTTLLANVALDNTGTASYTTSSLAPGVTHAISAVYSGDTNFIGSTSSASAGVTVAPLDFTMTITGPSSATVIPGQSISYQVTVTPMYGTYAGPVNFAISGLPASANVTFSPASIAANGGAQTVTVTIAAAPATAANHAPPTPSPEHRAAPLALAFLLLFGAGTVRRRGRAMRRFLAIVLLLAGGAAAATLSGCGGGFFAQAPQNYNVTITATAANLQHTVNVTLNVQ